MEQPDGVELLGSVTHTISFPAERDCRLRLLLQTMAPAGGPKNRVSGVFPLPSIDFIVSPLVSRGALNRPQAKPRGEYKPPQ